MPDSDQVSMVIEEKKKIIDQAQIEDTKRRKMSLVQKLKTLVINEAQ